MKNLLLLFLFCFLWVLLLPLYPSVGMEEKQPPEEEYVLSVMLGMCEDVLPDEALKAIAVTLRTYIYYNGKILPEGELITAVVSAEQGENLYNAVKRAVFSTEGEYITYSGRIINACFHLCSNKNTADGDAPYLLSVPTPDESAYPGFYSEKNISALEISAFGKGEIISVSYGSDGRVKSVEFEKGYASVSEFTEYFSLASNDFTLNSLPDGGYTAFCRGVGNGCGLSLYGACLLAEEGKNYRQIISHYFSGTCVTMKI